MSKWTVVGGGGFVGATPGGGNFADGETPTGAQNGSNATYTLAHVPHPSISLILVVNGIVLQQGTDYTISVATITLANLQPNSSLNEWIKAWYRY